MVDFFLKTVEGVKRLATGKRGTAKETAEPKKPTKRSTASTSSETPAAGTTAGKDQDAPPPRPRRKKPAAKEGASSSPRREQAAKPKRTPRRTEEPASRSETSDDSAPPRRRRRRRKPASERSPDAPAQAPVSSEPWDPASFEVPVVEGKMRFHDLDLPNEVMHAIADQKFEYGTPIQTALLPETLTGRDAFGKAQTGTGKTAAFLITALTHLLRNPLEKPLRKGTPRVLMIAPTRELALQIEKDARSLTPYIKIRLLAVYGGTGYQKQQDYLDGQVDILVATPGRLLDYKRKNILHLSHVEILVIDEADRMLDMGFIPDVREIIHSTPSKTHRQTLFFSATLDERVRRLAGQWTKDAVTVEIDPEHIASESIDQKVFVVTADQKFPLLVNMLDMLKPRRVIVFANRRATTERIHNQLLRYEKKTALLSGALPQNKRTRTLEEFRNGDIRVLVATDVAGRGLHIEGVDLVVNFNLSSDAEDYVHRIGRTGRAGETGTSVSFACEEDSFYIPEIEAYIGKELVCEHPDEAWLKRPEPRFEATRLVRHHDSGRDRRRGDHRHGGSGRPRRGGPRSGGGSRGGSR